MSATTTPPAGLGLDRFLGMPRVSTLRLAPDGRRLVVSVATVAPDGKRFVSALWEVDPDGRGQPRRLTRSAPGESSPAFLPDGSLLFTSGRPDPDAKPDDEREEGATSLWLLPAGGGEAREVAAPPAGVDAVAVARDAGTVVYGTSLLPGAETADEDRQRMKQRRDAGVTALLFESERIRHWDHFLGPRERRLLGAAAPTGEERLDPRALTPEPGRALDEVSFDVTPDGSTVVTGWWSEDRRPAHVALVAIDVASGERRVLVDEPASWVEGIACSPDGRYAACTVQQFGDREHGPTQTLWLVDLASGEGRNLVPDFPHWPEAPVWAPDSRAVLFTSYEEGRVPAFRVDLDSGAVTRLSAAGAFGDLRPSPDGSKVYALRNALWTPPEVVVLDARAADQEPTGLPTPGLPVTLPGRVEEVRARAADGTPLRSWLALPADASPESPAPLVLWIHGGPLGSWAEWHWRWNPHVLAARGYAVLMPDPGLSVGYGQAFINRGRGHWGEPPFSDLMATVDAACERGDVDATRTAAMGGSYGGYMANWVAGHTDRFRCIVTHASIWSMDQFHGTTDYPSLWELEFGAPEEEPERYAASSPATYGAQVRTPVLVIHGEQDLRVPIGEGLRLWTDLQRRGVDAKFLYFPDENHWVLKPPHIRLWYEAVLAFLDHHLLGKDWSRPGLL